MASDPPLSVLFLWHQHQPLYKDALTDHYELPWVRLHATKDYVDMVALLDEFPTLKANFNLVPSLLVQVDDYAQGKAKDKFLELTEKRAADLTNDERQFILQNFFMAHWEHMVDPHVRYRELLDKRGRILNAERLARAEKYFNEQDWRDLQTWFNLTWMDPLWREKDDLIKALFEKGKNFTEEDKHKLLEKQREICGWVVAKHKELQDRGQIEITTTPFYHPIMPLLCDTEAARMALPHVHLPSHRFQHPEDAREQLRLAIDDYAKRFGRPPQGLWPSEGSISEETARLVMEAGFRWLATDEAVLAHSFSGGSFTRDDIYEPYRWAMGEKNLSLFFRDHELSDAVGFVYSTWDPEDAANDFIDKLHHIQKRLKARDGDKFRPHVVSVILDGENCWEYYKSDGLPFLRALYRRLAEDSTLQTVRASDYLDHVTELKTLSKLWSGSWINANFSIWLGHSEDNNAWDWLFKTRQFLVSTIAMHPESAQSPEIKQAWQEIYIAEGSDWCWWYGDDHSSANDETFDYLFRKHLMNVYTLLGEKIPAELHFPIKKKRTKAVITPPLDFMTPTIDGRISSYFEWQSAGCYMTEAGATGTMHKSENLVKAIYFGFDLENLYLRLDPNRPASLEALKGISLKLIFSKPENTEILVQFDNQFQITFNSQPPKDPKFAPTGIYQKVLELKIPLKYLGSTPQTAIELVILVLKDGLEQERWPADSMLQLSYPTEDVFIENWRI